MRHLDLILFQFPETQVFHCKIHWCFTRYIITCVSCSFEELIDLYRLSHSWYIILGSNLMWVHTRKPTKCPKHNRPTHHQRKLKRMKERPHSGGSPFLTPQYRLWDRFSITGICLVNFDLILLLTPFLCTFTYLHYHCNQFLKLVHVMSSRD